MNRIFSWGLIAVFALASSQKMTAQAPLASASTGPNIIPIGSPLRFGGTNAPDTYSANTTFGSTPVTVDNGNVSIWQQQVPTGPNGEWDVFYVKTTKGGPLAGNINAYWDISMDYTLSTPAFFDQVVQQWMVNGNPVGPLTNGIGSICCAATSNPILPGASYYNSGFSGPLAAGVQTNWRQIFVSPYSLVQSGGVNPNTANEFVFGLHFTLQNKPTVTGAISASQFGAFPTFGPGSWIEIYGTNLAGDTEEWGGANFNGINAPTKLGGTSVTIGGQAAFVQFISSTQVNVQVPAGVAVGTQPLVVTTEAGSSAPFSVIVDAVQPGLYGPAIFDVGGTQYVGALFSDGLTFVLPPGAVSGFTSKRAKPGDTITLYGIGFGSVNPDTPPGQIAQGQTTIAAPVTVSIGGTSANVLYDGLAPTFVGLYQLNVVVPSIAASDSAALTFSLGGAPATQKLSIAIGN